jgi:hypothetical protein
MMANGGWRTLMVDGFVVQLPKYLAIMANTVLRKEAALPSTKV